MDIQNEKSIDISDDNKNNDKISLNNMEDDIHEKNIENLVNEIKETEKKIKKEINEKKYRKEFTPRISLPKIQLTPINIQTIQYILSNKNRNQNMLIVLNALLSNMKFVSIVTDLQDKEKLISSLSNCLKLEKKPKGSILFKYGNKGAKLYIVLGGEISVLILKKSIVELTFLNYIKYLFYLKIIKEEELAKKIVATNQTNFFKLTERYLDKCYEDILSFINKYYTLTTINEYEENRMANFKKTFKMGMGMKEFKENINKFESEKKIDNINNNLKTEENDDIKFKRLSTIDETKFDTFSDKIDILSNINRVRGYSEKKNNFVRKRMNELEENKIFNVNEFNEKNDFKPRIKYKVTSKIPNFSELDIGTLGPHDISNLVNFVINYLEIYYQKTNKVYTVDEYIKLCSVNESLKISDKNIRKEKMTIFQYFEITKKVEGDIFGELALQHEDNKRTATMITTKDSVFGYLSKSDYNLCLKGIEMKKRKLDINFIMSFSLFEEQNWIHFDKQYFNYFKKENLVSGQTIINQNQKLENIYFIMEGQIEISTKLSFDEIFKILKRKNKKIKFQKLEKDKNLEEDYKYSIENVENSEEIINKEESNNEDKSINAYNKAEKEEKKKKYMFLSKNQIKRMEEVKTFRLCVVDNKDILGLNDICTEDKISFIKATCLSSDAVVFSIKINILEQLRKRNRQIEKNVEQITQKRELLMIERLKSTTNQFLANTKQYQKENMINLTDNESLMIKKNKRLMSAVTSQYSNNLPIEYENKIGNYKYETIKQNLIKENLDKNKQFVNKKSNQTIYAKNQNNQNKKNYNSNEKIVLNFRPLKSARKSGFTKFMESVTERVNQINNHHLDYPRLSRLFCPVYKKKLRKDSGLKENEKVNLKLKEQDNNKWIKTENNDINSIKKFSIVQLELSDDNSIDNKTIFTKFKENKILSNAYLNNIISKKKAENIIPTKNENKTISVDKLIKANKAENQDKKSEDFIKQILGVRYKEYDVSNGQKTFNKMIIPYIEDVHRLRNKKNKKVKNNTFTKYKSVKVDLLFYDQLTKKNKASYLKDILIQKQAKQRLFSRNVIKNFKTINVAKNSNYEKFAIKTVK